MNVEGKISAMKKQVVKIQMEIINVLVTLDTPEMEGFVVVSFQFFVKALKKLIFQILQLKIIVNQGISF